MDLTVSSEDLSLKVYSNLWSAWRQYSVGELVMVSFVATESQAKAIIALLKSKGRYGAFHFGNTQTYKSKAAYRIARTKLPKHNAVHVVAVRDDLDVVYGNREEALGAYLRSEKVTTPIHESWIPQIVEKLVRHHKVITLQGEGIESWLIDFDDATLDRYVTELLQGGKIKVPGDSVGEPVAETSLGGYLEKFGDRLIQKVEETAKPLLQEVVIPENGLLRQPYEGQWPFVLAAIKTWQHGRNSAVLSMEMGTGKTLCSMAAVHIHAQGRPYRSLVICPPHLLDKWKRELEITLPEVNCVIMESYREILKLRNKKPEGAEWIIVSENMAKMGSTWEPMVIERRHMDSGAFRCPNCGAICEKKIKEDGADVWVPMAWSDLKKTMNDCRGCGEKLWSWTHKLDRWPIANIVQRKCRGAFRYLIIDEAHGGKGQNTAQGLSYGKMASAIPYKMALTGTLLNGYADSVFPMGFRFFPGKFKALGLEWGGVKEFITRYGRVETTTEFKNQEMYTNRQSRGGGRTVSIKIKPGIVPNLYGDCLMENTVFASLGDLGLPIPANTEILHACPMDEELESAYERVEADVRSAIRQLVQSGSKAALSVLMHSLNGWPDHPWEYGDIGYKGEEGKWIHVCTPEELDKSVIRPKEQELIDAVLDAKARGRQVWIYVEMTMVRDVQIRVKELLDAYGLDVRILRSQEVGTREREEWIFANGKADVIISNPMLVKTGLDLFDRGGNHNFSVLMFYQTSYNLDTLRQAAGRSCRIGQWLETEVHYFFYEETMQESCVRLMSQKVKAAKAIEGKFSHTALGAMTAGEDSLAMIMAEKLINSTRAKHENRAKTMLDRAVRDLRKQGASIEVSFGRGVPKTPGFVRAATEAKQRSALQTQTVLPAVTMPTVRCAEAAMPAKSSIVTAKPLAPKIEATKQVEVKEAVVPSKLDASRIRQWRKHCEEVEQEVDRGESTGIARANRLKLNLSRLTPEDRAAMLLAIPIEELFRKVEDHVRGNTPVHA